MNIEQAKRIGAQAHVDGRLRAPALNQAFLREAATSTSPLVDLLDAYIAGWTVAALAKDAPLDSMPSVAEFRRLMT
jgi:hypothetical protein